MEIGEINKGRDKIIFALKEFKGKRYIDIRTYFENDDGEWLPTKKGITFSPDLLDDVMKILEDAKKAIEKTDG
ncbi:MAG: transcriptional coactivator p15/PC4 family protein [Syntrophorhabdaceae bacterium]|nr:transcriptional coactivator p15/PC4 family protein [Syntrophorhabdales bacterium]MBP9561491.1 transcriptional coactivator p15/PC4 family protein [Syntrophorhabdaceae bacterium]